jgi:cephalosporin-C deacetylase-like acetyl esterase
VSWQIKCNDRAAGDMLDYNIKSGGLKETAQGTIHLTNNAATLESTFSAPGALLATVKWGDSPRTRALAGAVADPFQIEPSTNCPADFDSFWADKVKQLESVPEGVELISKPSGKPGVDYWEITMNNIHGHIHGQLARPHDGEKFPALLIVQWAGVYALQTNWVTDRAAAGWLTLNIEAHDLPIHEPEAFYHEQSSGPLKNYWNIGNDDRDKSYFLAMYLSCFRAATYLTERPDWNGKTLAVTGDSQGGLQTLMIAGLHPKITAAMALVPAGCDMLGPQIGRRGGWPQWYDNVDGKDPAAVHNASRYYDVVNFAARIKCPVLTGLGLRDETCPPAGVLAAVNQIRSPKKILILPLSAHQDSKGSQAPFRDERDHVWLPALRDGKMPPIE